MATLTSFDAFNHTLEGLWGLTDLRPPPRGVFALKDNGFVRQKILFIFHIIISIVNNHHSLLLFIIFSLVNIHFFC